MSRTAFAARILKPIKPQSILDIGCRDARLAREIPEAEYAGADLKPDLDGRVKYVGDVMETKFDRTFEAVVALDILEHLDRPSELFDRLVPTAQRVMLVSLPNTYDLKSRVQFATGAGLGRKYDFVEDTPQDRHRWVMSREQIVAFYQAKAAKHGMDLQVLDLTYGASMNRTPIARLGRLMATFLPKSLASATVFGLFTKQAATAPPRA